jgi:Rad3-related DNA helicase
MVSATVTPRDATHLGIPKAAVTYKSFTSPFDRRNRPVLYVPTASISRNSTPGQLRIWINRIDQIIEKELEEKGIIHTVSYARAKYIYEHSQFKHLMMIHDPRGARSTIDAFKEADPPAILLSPSVSTGYDFPGDQARWQIIAKVPFIDNRPLATRARSKQDHEYLNYKALVALIQMCGRGVRSDSDRCRTYIIDDNWRWFRSAVYSMMPRWFKESLVLLDGTLTLPREPVLTGRKGRW